MDASSQAAPRPAVLVAVAAGGCCGGLGRYAVTSSWPTTTDAFPWATLAVNTSGALLLGLLLTYLAGVRSRARPYLRAALGPGFLGAYTTFSAVAASTCLLAASARYATAATYLVCSVVAGLTAAEVGAVLGRAAADRGSGGPPQDPDTQPSAPK